MTQKVIAYYAANPIEAELVIGLLQTKGISAAVNSNSSAGGIGELPADVLETAIQVPVSQLSAAREIINDYETANHSNEWFCQNCQEKNPGSFEFCWSCQTPQPSQ
ncbi:DUF2007 domain-containing protein [Idiomarina tyrosinivorans]|nr:DUF2007 domain-containing protein [Idiomarina tyrosinivorans]